MRLNFLQKITILVYLMVLQWMIKKKFFDCHTLPLSTFTFKVISINFSGSFETSARIVTVIISFGSFGLGNYGRVLVPTNTNPFTL